MKRKLLSVLVAFAMVLTLLPVTALAVSAPAEVKTLTVGSQQISELGGGDGTAVSTPYTASVEVESTSSVDISLTMNEGSDSAKAYYLASDQSSLDADTTISSELSGTPTESMTANVDMQSNQYLWIAIDKDNNESKDIFYCITVSQKEVVVPPTEITGDKITITDTTGKVTCKPEQSGTVKAAVTTAETDPQITNKISGWNKNALTEDEVKTQCGTGEFAAVDGITLKTTDNNKYLVVIELVSGNKVVGVGAKKIEGIKSDVATIKSITVNGASNSISPETGADTLNNATPMNAEFTYVEGGKDEITITVTATDTNAKVSYKANPNNEGEITEGGTENSVTISDVAKLEYGTPITYGIKVVAENGTTTKYYKLTLTMKEKGPEKPVVTVTSGNIKAGTKDPKVTLSSTVPFTDNTNTHYTLSDTSTCGLSVGSVEINNKTATVNLTGTAKGNSFTITVAKNAFGDAASDGADAVTVTIDKVEPNISVDPSTITPGTQASEITLTVTSTNLPFKSGVASGDFNIEANSGTTGLTVNQVTKDDGENKVTITFTGEAAKAGTITIQAKEDAYDNMASKESNTVTVKIETPSTSSGPSTPSTSVTNPSTDTGTGETKVDVNTNSTTSGTTAKATVTDTNMNKAVDSAVTEAAKQGTAPVVEVEVKTSDKADSLNVTLPAASLEKLAEAEDASLVITSDIAEVALDSTALTALADQATGSTVTLEVAPVAASALNEAQAEAAGEAPVVDLSLVSNGVAIHDYNNGKITVTLPYTLAQGQTAGDVVVYFLDDDASLTPCDTSYAGGKVTFVTVHLSKYVIADADLGVEKDCPSEKYADVDQTKWYHEGVDYAIRNGLMNGTGADTFAPDATTTRAMIVTILYRLEDEPAVTKNIPFEDVPAGQWYADAINWAAANGIVTGYSETRFGPNDPITREQMATILYRYASYKGYDVSVGEDTNILSYTDALSISEYAIPAMQWAAGSGLMEGTSAATLSPKGNAVRAQVATILKRFCEGTAK